MQQAGKLFGSKFRAYALKDRRKCPKCYEDFTCKYDKYGVNHRPILMKCGHNLCEKCIEDAYPKLVCPECSALTPVSRHKYFRVRDNFDLNFYMFGELCNYTSFREQPNASLLNCTTSKNVSADVELENENCRECDNPIAVGSCRNCNNASYCMKCFYRVHNHSKVLQSHKFVMFAGDRTVSGLQPTPIICTRHRNICTQYCMRCNCICCEMCIKQDHKEHMRQVQRLIDFNKQSEVDVLATIETIKSTRENIRKSQREIAHTQAELRVDAAETFKIISEKFLQLHEFLQNKQREICEHFEKLCEPTQNKLKDASKKLDKNYKILNIMLQNLELYAEKPPFNIHVSHVLTEYTRRIEQVAVVMEISPIENNPFSFKIKTNAEKEIASLFNFKFIDPVLKIRTAQLSNNSLYSLSLERAMPSAQHTQNFEYSRSNSHSSTENSSKKRFNKPKQRKNQKMTAICAPEPGNTNSTADLSQVANKKIQNKQHPSGQHMAKITYLKDPNNFYIQLEDNSAWIGLLISKYLEAYHSSIPRNIDIGSVYLVYYDNDKQWYRGLAKRAVSKDVFEAYLVDIGRTLEIERKSFRDLDTEDANRPFTAVLCTLYELMPAGEKWTTEAINFFMSLTKNNRLCIQLIEHNSTHWKIDILTLVNGDLISVHDSFLYTGLALSTNPEKNKRPMAALTKRIPRQVLHLMEVLNVNTSHVESPHEFYVIKNEHLQLKRTLVDDLNREYDAIKSTLTAIPLGCILLACAVKKRNKWHRGRIEDILPEGKILVHLVDEGITDIFDWHEIYPLKSVYVKQFEYTIKCRLADIEPLRENGYMWTDEAISEFKMLSSNPLLVMTVHGEIQQQYLVGLYMIKKEWNANIGALLVKSGHGLSSGKHTSISEIKKINNNLDAFDANEKCVKDKDINFNNANSTNSEESVRTLKRSNVNVMNIIDPGHIYLQLADLLPGIKSFLALLQTANEHLKTMPSQEDNWYVGDACLVLAELQQPYNLVGNLENCSIYRGVITDIDYDTKPSSPYKVFLRDYGITLKNIRDFQLRPIPAEFDKVANSVFRCHLACIKPTAGKSEWSQSAIDCLKNVVEKMPNLSATLYGERVPKAKSTAILLWGTTNEINDPLAPTVTKHTCINRLLVNSGLAHLTDRFDFGQQVDDLIQKEVNDNEISIEQWVKSFPQNVDLKAVDEVNQLEDESLNAEKHTEIDYILELENESSAQQSSGILQTPPAWLEYKNIEKSVFVAKPTYLDNNCIIHLHDSDDDKLISEMCAHINSVYAEYLPNKLFDEQQHIYGSGQACIAKYHLDGKYYRCLIHGYDNETQSYIVRFIDYGNLENVSMDDVRLLAPFPEIPAMASRYRLDGMHSIKTQDKHTTLMLDTIHQLIVNKLVQVRLVGNQLTEAIKCCNLRIDSIDLLQILSEKGFVEHKAQKENKIEDPIAQYLKRIDQKPEEKESVSNKKRIFDQADYKRMHNELKLHAKKYELELSGMSEQLNDNDSDNEMNVALVGQSFSDCFWPNEPNVDDEDSKHMDTLHSDQFCPNDTSTVTQYSGTECFKRPHLPFGVKGFGCEIVRILSPTIIQIKPLLREFQFQDTVLQQRIQHIAESAPVLKQFTQRTVCLARFCEDNLYYRATIRSYNPLLDTVDVLFVDYMHTETVNVKELLECPEELATLPLRTFRVRLFGISANPMLRDRAICQELATCLSKKNFYASVKKRPCEADIAAGDLIQISLHESNLHATYIYQSLIEKGIYDAA